jgi:DNA-binding transcriptional ArsR family regulator
MTAGPGAPVLRFASGVGMDDVIGAPSELPAPAVEAAPEAEDALAREHASRRLQAEGANVDIGPLVAAVADAAGFLKALGHDGRLLILCHLLDGAKSVNELEALLSARQAVVSQQLARLRHENLVRARRDGLNIIYSIHDPKVVAAIGLLAQLYKGAAEDRPGTDPSRG